VAEGGTGTQNISMHASLNIAKQIALIVLLMKLGQFIPIQRQLQMLSLTIIEDYSLHPI
jgi:hypothetical protein